ncbi:putative transcription factor interactor and regulator CCHC(Zn) family [Helianthus annuus]|uniref:Transcription factor interactor and regulator CCHC(Zn) family n=1 Tax=Helianthus annuus TaxID=4232 RepID=A0A9K3JSA6_HELAN|nr:putative transcription factor interactor and regulator CCHC(Zn) family [Helianthus annuus]KAJ0953260.1 putative transcription factor interactor and regulator CCHC(Zn) family [Helianthus annuus]
MDKTSNSLQSQKKPDIGNNRNFSQSSSVNRNQSNNSNQGSYVGKQPKCNKCMFHHRGSCTRVCDRCNKVGHMAKDCRVWLPKPPQQQERQQPQPKQGNRKGCFQCGDEGHFNRDCPQLNRDAGNNNNTGNDNNGKMVGTGHVEEYLLLALGKLAMMATL